MGAMSLQDGRITPRFWYCPLCGYMIVDRDSASAAGSHTSAPECPMCGEDTIPCWECIATHDFSEDWCAHCDRKTECEARPRASTKW